MEAEMAAKSSTKSTKRTGAIRIPKSYRGAASKIGELSRNPLVIEAAAAGLIAAAGALMRNKSARAAASKVGASARDAASETADLAGRIGHAVAAAITNATHRLYPEGDGSVESPQVTRRPAASPAKQRTASAAKQRTTSPAKQRAASSPAKRRPAAGAKARAAPIKSKDTMPYVS
jgi:hypothetical protein